MIYVYSVVRTLEHGLQDRSHRFFIKMCFLACIIKTGLVHLYVLMMVVCLNSLSLILTFAVLYDSYKRPPLVG